MIELTVRDAGLLVVLILAVRHIIRKRLRPPIPPGPPGLPILGVALSRPLVEPWLTYTKWGEEYGDNGLSSFHVLGRRIIILGNAKIADDLLVKRAVKYSDRPLPMMGGVLLGREKSIFLMPMNERFKTYRRLYHQSFGPRPSQQYWPMQTAQAYKASAIILDNPSTFATQLRTNIGAMILNLAYGYSAASENDPFVQTAEDHMQLGSITIAPGRWYVDSLPILRFVPAWFPGAEFKRLAAKWKPLLLSHFAEPMEFVKREIALGRAKPSFASDLIQKADGTLADDEMMDIAFWTSGGLYAAGADTIISTLTTFFYILMTHPHIQTRAQAHVDALIAQTGRLPTVEDRAALPFLDDLLKELFRWGPPAPLGVPRLTREDDVYNVEGKDYYIPKDAVIMPNIWAMMHDADVYPDPFTFNPDRYASTDAKSGSVLDPSELVWGFGKRVCAGRHIAESTIIVQMATTLATMDVSMHPDDVGNDFATPTWVTAVATRLQPFKCQIKERSKERTAMLWGALDS